MKKNAQKATRLTLRLNLKHITPEIWREVAIDGFMSFADLHELIQTLFLWDNSHLHLFSAKGISYTNLEAWDDLDKNMKEEATTIVDSVLKKRGDKLKYEYDFGDGWEIDIQVMDVTTGSSGRSADYSSVCLGGSRAAPPEDCGGIPGYYDLIETFANPETNKSAEIIEELGHPWNPETFDINAMNYLIQKVESQQSQEVLSRFAAIVDEQLEDPAFGFVGETLDRLVNEGVDPETAHLSITMAFMRERVCSDYSKKIDQVHYQKNLDALPDLPWLDE